MNTETAITYDALIARHLSREEAETTREKKRRIMTKFMRKHFKRGGEPVGWEFDEERDAYVDEIRAVNKYTAHTVGSCLGQFVRTLAQMREDLSGPPLLKDRLAHQMTKHGTDVRTLAKESSIPYMALHRWFRYGLFYGGEETMERLKVLETFFGTAEGYFTSAVRPREAAKVRPRTEWGKTISGLIPLEYTYKDWTDEMNEEFSLLESFKTTTMKVPQDPRQRSVWRSTGRRATREIYRYSLESFYGFLMLPSSGKDKCLKGKGYAAADLSMALLADWEIVQAYLAFMSARRGIVTRTQVAFLHKVLMFLDPRWGFLRVFGEEFRLKGPNPARSAEEWTRRCDRTAESCFKYINKEGRFAAGKGRKVWAPIMHIVLSEDPMGVLEDLVEKLEEDLPNGGDAVRVAVKHRNLLLLKLLIAHPLRIEMFSYAKLGTNLLRTAQGGWVLTFEAEEFKNEQGHELDTYHEPVPEDIWESIDEYLEKHRPQLCGAGGDFAFLPEAHDADTFSTVVGVNREEGTVTLASKGRGVRTVDVSEAKHSGGIAVGDRIAVKRRMDASGKPLLNGQGLEIGKIVVRQKEQGDLWALGPQYLSTIIREMTACIPGPDGKAGTGFGPHAVRNISGSAYLRDHPGDYEGLAVFLHDDADTARRYYAWIDKKRKAEQRLEERKQRLAQRAEARKRLEGGNPGSPGKRPAAGESPGPDPARAGGLMTPLRRRIQP